MRRWIAPLLLGGLALGCWPEVDRYVIGDDGVRLTDAGPIEEGEDAGPPRMGTCTATIQAGEARANLDGCFLDETISNQVGTFSFDCQGNGAARLSIGGVTYSGSISDGLVHLEHMTSYQNTGGAMCTWNTFQTVRGYPTSGTLEWRYREQPAPGELGCANACNALAELAILP